MKAKVTNKIKTETVQFAWDNEVLYLQVKNYLNNKRAYSVSAVPDYINDNDNAGIDNGGVGERLPKGNLASSYGPSKIKEKINNAKNMIDLNIEYLNHVKEILVYIEEIEKENSKKTIKDWGQTGFLDGLSEEQSLEFAEYLDEMVSSGFIASLREEEYEVSSEFILFILKQLYIMLNKTVKFASCINYREVFGEIEKQYERFKVSELNGGFTEIGKNTAFISWFCNKYVEDLKTRGII